MNAPSLRNRKPIVYVFFGLYLFFGVFFLALSCVPGSASSQQSNWVGNVLASVLNLFEDTSPSIKVQPTSIKLLSDSSYLNLADPSLSQPEIALGTTTMLQFAIEKPSTLNKSEYVDPSFSVVRNDNSNRDDYDFNIDSGNAVVRIISANLPMENCSITVKAGTGESSATAYTYRFSIVENPAPVYYDGSLNKTTLRPNESAQIRLNLKNPNDSNSSHNDAYLRRYYDPTLLDYSPKNGGCFFDRYGVVRATQAGFYSLQYGHLQKDIEVSGTALPLPSQGDLTLSASGNEIHLQDYDYADTGVNLSAHWPSSYVGDKGVTWLSSDPLICRLLPSEDGQSCVAKGYRKLGNAVVTAYANSNQEVLASYSLTSTSTAPTSPSWNLVYANGEKALNHSLTAHSAGNIVIFNKYNTDLYHISNPNLLAESDASGIVVSGSGTPYITLSFQQVGKGNVSISAEGNSDCSFRLSVDVQAELNQDPDDPNYQVSVRKVVGHFGWFFLGGILGYLFFYFFLSEKSHRVLWPLLFSSLGGVLFAFLSEGIQYFIPGRGASIGDSGIDIGGYLAGGLLCLLVVFLIARHQKKKSVSAPKEPTEETPR
jgi:VanZ family protein